MPPRRIRLSGTLFAGGALAAGSAGMVVPLPASADAGSMVAQAASDTIPSVDEVRRLLGPDGDRAAGLAALGARAASLPPPRATLWIQLLAAVERTDPGLAPLLLDAVTVSEGGAGIRGAELLERATEEAREEDRSALLGLAALLARHGNPERAARLRARILDEHPGSMEAPEAAYHQALWLLGPGAGREEALVLLEDLIVSRPNHPVVPAARALLLAVGRP